MVEATSQRKILTMKQAIEKRQEESRKDRAKSQDRVIMKSCEREMVVAALREFKPEEGGDGGKESQCIKQGRDDRDVTKGKARKTNNTKTRQSSGRFLKDK